MTKHRRFLSTLLYGFIAGFICGYIIALTKANKVIFLTHTISIESKQEPLLYAILIGSTLVILLAAMYYTLRTCFHILHSKYAFIIFGLFIFLLGAGGLAAALYHIPSKDLQQFIHIIVIGAFFALMGLFMIYIGYKENRKREKLLKKRK